MDSRGRSSRCAGPAGNVCYHTPDLDYFNLKSLDQLPALAEIRDLETLNAELGFTDPLPAGLIDPADVAQATESTESAKSESLEHDQEPVSGLAEAAGQALEAVSQASAGGLSVVGGTEHSTSPNVSAGSDENLKESLDEDSDMQPESLLWWICWVNVYRTTTGNRS